MGPEDATLLWPGATFSQQVGHSHLVGELWSLCGAQRAKVGLQTCSCCLSLSTHCPCRPRAVLDPAEGIVPAALAVSWGSLPGELGYPSPAPTSRAYRLYKFSH